MQVLNAIEPITSCDFVRLGDGISKLLWREEFEIHLSLELEVNGRKEDDDQIENMKYLLEPRR